MNQQFHCIKFLLFIFLYLGYSQTNFTSNTSAEKKMIKSDQNSIWSTQEHKAVEDEAEKFVDAIKIKDMNTISKQILYPIELIDIKGKNIKFNNEKDFSSFNFDQLFDEKFIETITSSKKLFSSWRGFMLGDGANTVWFSPDEKGVWLIYGIVAGDQLPIKIVK